jgi:hypothetical protein
VKFRNQQDALDYANSLPNRDVSVVDYNNYYECVWRRGRELRGIRGRFFGTVGLLAIQDAHRPSLARETITPRDRTAWPLTPPTRAAPKRQRLSVRALGPAQ